METAVAGQVFEDTEIIAGLLIRFDTLRSEAFRGSESLTLIERMAPGPLQRHHDPHPGARGPGGSSPPQALFRELLPTSTYRCEAGQRARFAVLCVPPDLLSMRRNATWPGEPMDLRYLHKILWISRWLWR